ncbi:hypothetical protein JB92DRAFT_2755655 [Gautieria morchelliformis]|nr:hypothetical protein JB92DRAFT_2755655 [Gautieria morchelliformis]
MANSIYSTKLGCHWTIAELTTYNITIIFDDQETFFSTDSFLSLRSHPKFC